MDKTSPRRRKEGTAQVFIWGRGGDGQLGHGDDKDQISPTECVGLSSQMVLGVACGGKHCCAVTKQGDVYSWGWNYTGQLGHGDFIDRWAPVLIKPLALAKALTGRKITSVAAGSDHTVAATDDGLVYAWGGNTYGQLGFKTDQGVELIPHLLLALHLKKVQSIACGGGHNLALTESGAVYSWGRGNNGRCGHGADKGEANILTPKEIKKLSQLKGEKVSAIVCGWSHSMCLTTLGSVFVWGRAGDGRLGIGGDQKTCEVDLYDPVRIEWFSQNGIKITQIAGGYYHSAALDTQGRVYTWGWGEHGQLGHGNGDTCYEPCLVQFSESEEQPVIVHISAGGFHTAVVTADGRLLSWGLGEHGQLGVSVTPENPRRSSPTLVPLPGSAKLAFLGWWHTIVLVEKIQNVNHEENTEDHLITPPPTITPARDIQIEEQLQDLKLLLAASPKPFRAKRPSKTFNTPMPEYIRVGEDSDDHSSNNDNNDPINQFDNQSQPHIPPPSELSPEPEVPEPIPKKPPSLHPIVPPEDPPEPRPTRALSPNRLTSDSITSSLRQSQYPSPPHPVTSAVEKAAVFLASVFFQEDVHQKTVQINRKKSQAQREASKIEKVTQIQNKTDQLGHIWTQQILPNWEKMKAHSKTIELWRKGIPTDVRGLVWEKAIGNELNLTPQYYSQLLVQARKVAQTQKRDFQSPSRLIEVDVPRTFGATELFLKEGPYHQHLMEILESYAFFMYVVNKLHNTYFNGTNSDRPEVGYVQGMSYLAGMLLLYNEPCPAFISFANLLNNHFLLSLFKMDIKQILRHIKVYDLLFSFNLPELHDHFRGMGISAEQYLLDWFLTIFSKALPIPVASRGYLTALVWDLYFLYGEVFLMRTALAILHANKEFLLDATFEQCVLSLKHLGANTEEDRLFRSIKKIQVPKYVHEFISKLQDYAKDGLDDSDGDSGKTSPRDDLNTNTA